jgi:threonine synthase
VTAAPPRFVAVQAEGCAPLVRAWEDKAETTTPIERPFTNAPGLRVPGPFAGRQMLRILRDTGGYPLAVSEAAIVEAQRLLAQVEGIWTAPEAAATLAALTRMKDEGEVSATTRVVLILTGAGIKYPPPSSPPPIDLEGSREQMGARLKGAICPQAS